MPKTPRGYLNLLLEDDGMYENVSVARAGIDINDHENPTFELLTEGFGDGIPDIVDEVRNLVVEETNDKLSEIIEKNCVDTTNQDNTFKIFIEGKEKEYEDNIHDITKDILDEVLNSVFEEAYDNWAKRIEKNCEDSINQGTNERENILEINFQKERLQEWLTRNVKNRYLINDETTDEDENNDGNPKASNAKRVGDPYVKVNPKDISEVEGKVTKEGHPTGNCMVTLNNGDILVGSWKNGRREGRGNTTGEEIEKQGVRFVQGYYNDGVLQGQGFVQLTNGLEFMCFFIDGFVEGPVVGRLYKTIREMDRDTTKDENKVITGAFIGVYKAGVCNGYIWQGMLGGGWLHGQVDEYGHLSGDDIIYIYPDFNTCLCGTFDKGKMVAGWITHIAGVDFSDVIPVVKVDMIDKTGPVFSFSPATNTHLTVERHLGDPYENSFVCVKTSTVRGGGEGLFAKKNIPEGTFVSFYHGLLCQQGEISPNETSDYMIYLDWNLAPNSPSMDLPSDCWSTANYTASLAHKTNHSFHPNSVFCRFHHPRLGLNCLGLKTLQDIPTGEELFAHYHYSSSYAPQWFVDLAET